MTDSKELRQQAAVLQARIVRSQIELAIIHDELRKSEPVDNRLAPRYRS
jgi:hypothetical protein